MFGGRLGNRVAYRLRNACTRNCSSCLSVLRHGQDGRPDVPADGGSRGDPQFVGFGFAQILNMFLMVVFGAAMMFSIHWQLTLITLVTMPFLVFTAMRFEKLIHPGFPRNAAGDEQSDDGGPGEHHGRAHGQVVRPRTA